MTINYGSNPDIDKARTRNNYHLIRPSYPYRKEVENRITAARCKVRKDSVKFIDVLIGGTPEFMNTLSNEEMKAYFAHASNS